MADEAKRRRMEQNRQSSKKHYALHREHVLTKNAIWRQANKPRYQIYRKNYIINMSAEKRLARLCNFRYANAIRKGSVMVNYDKLLGLIGGSILPALADGVYEWETLDMFPKKNTVATHKLTFENGEAEWEITSQGTIAIRHKKVHLIRGYENKMSVTCATGHEFGDQFDILPNYFLHLVRLSTEPNQE
jgi:hypothetical protein